jgi:hypothetical protein
MHMNTSLSQTLPFFLVRRNAFYLNFNNDTISTLNSIKESNYSMIVIIIIITQGL